MMNMNKRRLRRLDRWPTRSEMNRLAILIIAVVLGVSLVYVKDSRATIRTPEELVAALYQVHKGKSDPLQYPRSKKLLGQYFSESLLKLYLSDQRQSKGEVGRIDFDPLYDAQDFQITDFKIVRLDNKGSAALVAARFKNLGVDEEIVFEMRKIKTGWRIADIKYKDGRTLMTILKS
jgi:Protein of unknown function (DUF3828)